MTIIAIFDYGVGNIFNIKNSIEQHGVHTDIITDFNNVNNYSGLIFPGVGNFDPAIKKIHNVINNNFKSLNIPILGICLGLEIFFEKSEEGKETGLKILDGTVVMISNHVKVPHMGWNNILITKYSKILNGIPDRSWVYFAHSYKIAPKNDMFIVAYCDYEYKIPIVIEKNNFYGTQFHPEKSGKIGFNILQNFITECRK